MEDNAVRRASVAFVLLMLCNYVTQTVKDAQVQVLDKSLSSKVLMATTALTLMVSPCTKWIVKDSVLETSKMMRGYFVGVAVVLLFTSTVELIAENRWAILITVVLSQALGVLATSLMWTLGGDLVPKENSIRYMSIFSAACTVGQAAGSYTSSELLKVNIPANKLLVVAALFLASAGQLAVWASSAYQQNHPDAKPTAKSKTKSEHAPKPSQALSFRTWDALSIEVTLYTLCYAMTISLLYLERASIVAESGLSPDEAGHLSAQVSLVAAACTFGVQLAMAQSARVASWVASGLGLFGLPVVTAAGFLALHSGIGSPLGVVLAFEVTRRVVAFAVNKPVRESLFRLMPRERKYVIKSFIDTFVQRGGGALGALLYDWVSTLGWKEDLVLNSIIAAVWLSVAIQLHSRQTAAKAHED